MVVGAFEKGGREEEGKEGGKEKGCERECFILWASTKS